MTAPSQLTLQITPSDTRTVWGSFSGSTAPAVIDVQNDKLVYDSSGVDNPELFFADSGATLTVENTAQFSIIGGGGFVDSSVAATVNISVAGSGFLEIDFGDLFLPCADGTSNIAISENARMSATTSNMTFINATIDVDSSPGDDALSLNLVVTGRQGENGIDFYKTALRSTGGARSALRTPYLYFGGDTRISVADTAICSFQFDSVTPDPGSYFVLDPGTAKMQFDPYTAGKYPFDFVNNTYPQGLFDITSAGTINKGTFVIKVASGFDANAIVTKGYVAIDGVVQGLDHVNFKYANGYATVYQTSLAR
jgi:hypothetical protein